MTPTDIENMEGDMRGLAKRAITPITPPVEPTSDFIDFPLLGKIRFIETDEVDSFSIVNLDQLKDLNITCFADRPHELHLDGRKWVSLMP